MAIPQTPINRKTPHAASLANTTADRAIDILLMFTEERPRWTAPEIAAEFQMPRSTTYRYLKSLLACSLVAEDGTGAYTLGQRIFPLARAARVAMPLQWVATAAMQRLHDLYGEVVIFYERVGADIIELNRIECRHRLRIAYHRQQLLPWPATASAKVLLAYAEGAERASLEGALIPTPYTPSTVGTRAALKKAIDRLKKEGFAYSDQELELGVRALSVPVFIRDRCRNCIAVSGPVSRLDGEVLPRLVKDLQATAAEVSRLASDF